MAPKRNWGKKTPLRLADCFETGATPDYSQAVRLEAVPKRLRTRARHFILTALRAHCLGSCPTEKEVMRPHSLTVSVGLGQWLRVPRIVRMKSPPQAISVKFRGIG